MKFNVNIDIEEFVVMTMIILIIGIVMTYL